MVRELGRDMPIEGDISMEGRFADLCDLAADIPDAPTDFSVNHDQYLYARQGKIETQWLLGEPGDCALIQLSQDCRRVDMWTTRRLPFEPKGVLWDARSVLRTALAKVVAQPQEFLDAQYTSSDTGFVDADNVLIYNVGPAAFNSASRYGLHFVRVFAPPHYSPNQSGPFHHHHAYQLRLIGEVATLHDFALNLRFSLPQMSASTKPHEYWWAAKQGQVRLGALQLHLSRTFSMGIVVSGPAVLPNCATILKPLFDGAISALHYDSTVDGQSPECILLAAKLGVPPISVAERLRAEEFAILGERRVVSSYREFVKWNPEDELCVSGQLLTRCDSESDWTIEVTVA